MLISSAQLLIIGISLIVVAADNFGDTIKGHPLIERKAEFHDHRILRGSSGTHIDRISSTHEESKGVFDFTNKLVQGLQIDDMYATEIKPSSRNIVQYVYSDGKTAKTDNEGYLIVEKYVPYKLTYEVLRNDLGHAEEMVSDVLIDGKSIGSCKPDGGDYDCTYFKCPGSTIVRSQTGLIPVNLKYVEHSWDCDCDMETWMCSKENTVPGRTPMTAVAKFTLKRGRCTGYGVRRSCFIPADNGAACNTHHDCYSDLCDSGFCRAKVDDNAACFLDLHCKSGRCNYGVCRAKGNTYDGGDCEKDGDCASGRCNEEVCRAKLDRREVCSRDGDCKSGNCHNFFSWRDGVGGKCD